MGEAEEPHESIARLKERVYTTQQGGVPTTSIDASRNKRAVPLGRELHGALQHWNSCSEPDRDIMLSQGVTSTCLVWEVPPDSHTLTDPQVPSLPSRWHWAEGWRSGEGESAWANLV